MQNQIKNQKFQNTTLIILLIIFWFSIIILTTLAITRYRKVNLNQNVSVLKDISFEVEKINKNLTNWQE